MWIFTIDEHFIYNVLFMATDGEFNDIILGDSCHESLRRMLETIVVDVPFFHFILVFEYSFIFDGRLEYQIRSVYLELV